MVHKSYDTLTMETHHDKFDIDFIRYTRLPNVVFNIFGTAIMMSILLSSETVWDFFTRLSLESVTVVTILGGVFFFKFLVTIARKGGAADANRLAGRRGLFSYSIMTFIILLSLVASGKVGLETLFGQTLIMVFSAQIFCAFLAVPFDYCSTLFFFKR